MVTVFFFFFFFGLPIQTPEGDEAAKLGIKQPEKFVMKPQREGGGQLPKQQFNINPRFLNSFI